MKEPGAGPEIEIREASYAGRNRDGAAVTVGPITFKINGGEFFSILGPDDENRGMLLRLIAGLDFPASGKVLVSGTDVVSAQQNVGFVFKEPSLLEWQTVFQNVLLPCEVRRLNRLQCEAQARRLLIAMGVAGYADRKPAGLSVGLAQRVSVCRALAHSPSLLLLDNPFHNLSGLDREQMATDLQRLWLTPRMTVVLGTTQIAEAVHLSDRVAVMAPDGRILQTISIDLPRPRRMDKATTPRIAEYCNSIRTVFHAGGMLT